MFTKATIIEVTHTKLGALPGINESYEPAYICRLESGKIVKAFPPPDWSVLEEGASVDVYDQPTWAGLWFNA